MKKFMISLLLSFGLVPTVSAQDTDVSTLDNVIYIEPFTASAGTQCVVSIKMKNSAPIRGFQFDLYLPDGVTAALTPKGRVLAELTERREADDEHTLTTAIEEDGAIRFLCGSQYDEVFTGDDGEIATITLNVAATVADGEYPVYLRTMKLTETDISHTYSTDEIRTTMTVGEAQEIRTLLDETSVEAPTAANGVNVRMKRTLKGGEWNTIVLPFAMSGDQVVSTFGSDVKIGDFTGIEVTEADDGAIVGIDVMFSDLSPVDGLEANRPYILKVNSDITEFDVDGVDLEPEDEPSFYVGKKTRERCYFIGTYTAQTTVPEECIFISGNKFYYSVGTTKMKAFRAYFDLSNVAVLDAYYDVAGIKARLVWNEEATAIEQLGIGTSALEGDVYDLSGRRLPDGALKYGQTGRGVYIVNGKKVVK